jgi:hypothetical protein
MIRYALACDQGHDFEAWFSASADFDDQSRRGLLACPICGSAGVGKQIMAPAVASRGSTAEGARAPAMQAMMMEAMGKVRRHVEDNFDYVGDKFAAEARSIHEGKSEERGIYGEATTGEVKALVADGVPVAPLPPPAPKKADVN